MPRSVSAQVERPNRAPIVGELANLTPSSVFFKTDQPLRIREVVMLSLFEHRVLAQVVFNTLERPAGAVLVFDAPGPLRTIIAQRLDQVEVIDRALDVSLPQAPWAETTGVDPLPRGADTDPGVVAAQLPIDILPPVESPPRAASAARLPAPRAPSVRAAPPAGGAALASGSGLPAPVPRASPPPPRAPSGLPRPVPPRPSAVADAPRAATGDLTASPVLARPAPPRVSSSPRPPPAAAPSPPPSVARTQEMEAPPTTPDLKAVVADPTPSQEQALADLPALDGDGVTLRFKSLEQYRAQHKANVQHGGLIAAAAPIPIGTQRFLGLQVPGKERYTVSARVTFIGEGMVGFGIDSFGIHKGSLRNLLD